MSHQLSKAAAIVGAAEANEIGYPEEPRSSLQLHIEAIKNVSDLTGIPISDIQGVFSRPGRQSWLSIWGCIQSTSIQQQWAAAHLRFTFIMHCAPSMPG